MKRFQESLDKFLDTFFHLPTLIIITLVVVVIVWQMYEVGFNFGEGFIRLTSNQGNVTLYWQDGCCHLDW